VLKKGFRPFRQWSFARQKPMAGEGLTPFSTRTMATGLVSLGSNVGDRQQTLDRAAAAIGDLHAVRIAALSHSYESLPAGGPAGQGTYLNSAARLETNRPPEALLADLQAVENRLARVRGARWDARTIDLDLLLYDEAVVDTESLTLPHPRMSFRRFVLEPACEIAPEMRHPTLRWTIRELLEHLNTADPCLAITGSSTEVTDWLADVLCQRAGCSPVSSDLSTDGIRTLLLALGEETGRREAPTVEFTHAKPKLVITIDAARRDVGPVLELNHVSGAEMIEESIAAITAMRPVCAVDR
jgi:2-amino-4-hydroxy-6-hydroxymethyldihydropteridine diphosphokinase